MARYREFLALSLASAIAHAATFEAPSPTLLPASTPLLNPGIGNEQASKLLNPSGTITVNSSVESISSVRYIRLQWSLIEKNGDNQFNWTPLDAAINAAVAAGKQAAISLMGHVPMIGGSCGYTDAIPSWYKTAAEARGPRCTGAGTPFGCTYYLTDYTISDSCSASADTTAIWTFNHRDPVYISQQLELIEALRARYDNPTWAGKIAYVDVRGGLGSWTELHVDGNRITGTTTGWPMPDWAGKQAVADAYLEFRYLPIIANVRNGGTAAEATNGSQWVYLCQQAAEQGTVLGWRTDGLDCTKWLMDPVFSAYPETQTCWKLGPVYGELCGSGATVETAVERDSWANGTTQFFALNERLKAWHVSGWNTKYISYPGNQVTYGAALDAWRAVGGYRLGVTGGQLPTAATSCETLPFSLEISNSGTAPVYRDYYTLAARFVPASGGVVEVDLNGDLRKALPGEPETFFGAVQLPPGSYTIKAGVKQDPAYTQVMPLKLAHAAADCALDGATYWCNVGALTVGEAPEIPDAPEDPEEPVDPGIPDPPEEPPVPDTTPPMLGNLSPNGSAPFAATATVSLTTNEPSACRWATAGSTWNAMAAMTTSNDLTHTIDLPVKRGGVYKACVRCRDLSGNESALSCTSFRVEWPATQKWIWW